MSQIVWRQTGPQHTRHRSQLRVTGPVWLALETDSSLVELGAKARFFSSTESRLMFSPTYFLSPSSFHSCDRLTRLSDSRHLRVPKAHKKARSVGSGAKILWLILLDSCPRLRHRLSNQTYGGSLFMYMERYNLATIDS